MCSRLFLDCNNKHDLGIPCTRAAATAQGDSLVGHTRLGAGQLYVKKFVDAEEYAAGKAYRAISGCPAREWYRKSRKGNVFVTDKLGS